MRITLLWIGKTRDRLWGAVVDEYLSRAGKMARIEIVELRDRGGASSERDESAVLRREGEAMLAALEDGDFLVVCDERGRELRSEEFARIMSDRQLRSTRRMVIAVGGYLGIYPKVRERADLVVALSRMTFTHEMARAILAEQVYRALTIVNGLPYQK
jgi:23S rRNA (pseudouridine1915-N3)-methyltransferase